MCEHQATFTGGIQGESFWTCELCGHVEMQTEDCGQGG